MEDKRTNSEDKEERVGRTKWMVNHSKQEELERLIKMVPEKTDSIQDLILQKLGKLNMSVEEMSDLAGFNRATGYKIINGKQRAERDMLLRIAFVLKFDYNETVQLLKSGKKAALTGDTQRDVAIIFGIVNGLSLGEMDSVLEEYGLPLLVPPKKNPEKKEYEYFAFISYNNRDSKWARQIQRQLEHYQLPSALMKENPGLPKRITPVFLDSSDLVAKGGLMNSLQKKLDDSRYLIVLCSTNSAVSPWVNEEVEYFINTGRKDQIIPVILNGVPHAEDPSAECYPPALAKLSAQEELLGISLKKFGKKGTLLRIVATLLELNLEQVMRRDAAVRRRKRMLYACSFLIAFAAVFSIAWYNIPHTAYYKEYTYVWERPVGIGKVSEGQRQKMDYTYRFTTQRGKVIQVERVNSAGILVEPIITVPWTESACLKFYYGTGKAQGRDTVVRTVCYDIYERELYEKSYSSDLTAVDFVQAGSSSISFTLGADLLASQSVTGVPDLSDDQERGDVVRYIQAYDENGYLVQRMFKRDNRGGSGGTPVQDSNGIWGLRYGRDEWGRITSLRYLEQNGEIMASRCGDVGMDYTYEEDGRIASEIYVDAEGRWITGSMQRAATFVEYDENDRVVKLSVRDADDKPVIDQEAGASEFRCSYDERGFRTSVSAYYNAEPCYNSDGFFRSEFVCDEDGRITCVTYYDIEGNPFPCADGYASATQEFDENGQVILTCYYGADGAPAVDFSTNVYAVRWGYTNKLNTSVDYLDSNGQLMTGKKGFAALCREYNEEHQLCREWYLDEKREPVRIVNGYAEIRCGYTDGNQTEFGYYDETGAHSLDKNGVATYCYTYEAGQIIAETYFGAEEEPVLCKDGYHKVTYGRDENGQLVSKTYYGTAGERVMNSDNFSSIVYEYDKVGRKISESYYDTQDQPWTISYDSFGTQYFGIQYEYDDRGNVLREHYVKNNIAPGDVQDIVYTYDDAGNQISGRYLNKEGEAVVDRDGHTGVDGDYDAFGRLIQRYWYTNVGEIPHSEEHYEYDDYGRMVKTMIFDESENLLKSIEYEYDIFGNCIQTSYQDEDGELVRNAEGYAICQDDYDVFGNKTDSRFYDESESPILVEGRFHIVRTFGVNGECLTTECYDTEERPVNNSDGFFKYTFEYDAYGRVIRGRGYEVEGTLAGGVSYTYNDRGSLIEKTYYGENGVVLDSKQTVMVFDAVEEGSPAAEAGLQAGDILIVYNNWSLESMITDFDSGHTLIQQEIQNGSDVRKHVIAARYNEENTEISFVEVTLPEGTAGYRVVDSYRYGSEIKEIMEQYELWLVNKDKEDDNGI